MVKNQSFYVNFDGKVSFMTEILLGIIQGSILGPVHFAIYVSPLFDLEFFLVFADNNFIPKFDDN